MTALPLWAEIVVAVSLLASGALSLIGAIGLLRLRTFFQRMHPPALATTFGTWCVALAGGVYFSTLQSRWVLHAWLVAILLIITAPVTTTLLARAALFRKRAAEAGIRDPADEGMPPH